MTGTMGLLLCLGGLCRGEWRAEWSTAWLALASYADLPHAWCLSYHCKSFSGLPALAYNPSKYNSQLACAHVSMSVEAWFLLALPILSSKVTMSITLTIYGALACSVLILCYNLACMQGSIIACADGTWSQHHCAHLSWGSFLCSCGSNLLSA